MGGQGYAARGSRPRNTTCCAGSRRWVYPRCGPAGLVLQPEFDTAILVTRYLDGSWQYRRLFMRLPPEETKHRARLLDAMAGLLVELHRHGVFWGDCSLANTLFSRDGQLLLGTPRRRRDLRGAPDAESGAASARPRDPVENVAMGMVDLAERLGRPESLQDELIAEAEQVRERYDELWDVLHAEPVSRLQRPPSRRGHHPSPQRPRLRSRRTVVAARSAPTPVDYAFVSR